MTARRTTGAQLAQLKAVLTGRRRMAIVLQDNPDPDALASAAALMYLVQHLADLRCEIVHSGTVGRAENRALVQYLDLALHQAEQVQWDRFDLLAMVDTQPQMGNNCLPRDLTPHIVIDHHPCKKATYKVPFRDVRNPYGATSTMLYEYLQKAGLPVEPTLATALFFGIRSDTQDLGRDCIGADIEAGQALFMLADKRALSDIQRGHVQRSYFRLLTQALVNTRVYRDAAVSNLGLLDNADMIAEIADLLLRDDRITAVLCYGFCDNKLRLSIRTRGRGRRADQLAKRVASHLGTGGGHPNYAGAQIVLKGPGTLEEITLEKTVCQRFLKALGVDQCKRESLLGYG